MSERKTLPDPRIGSALRKMREQRWLTLRQVAERLGRKSSFITHIARWERGIASPSADNLWKYLRAIGASFADLERELRPSGKPASSPALARIAREMEMLATRGTGQSNRRRPR